MKRYIYFLMITLSTMLSAQESADLNISMIESEVFKSQHKKADLNARHSDNAGGGYLLLNNYSDEVDYIVQHINSDLQIDTEKTFSFDKERIMSSFLIDDTFYFITNVINKDTRKLEFRSYYTSDYAKTFDQKLFLEIPIEDLEIKIGFSKLVDFLVPSFKIDNVDKDRNGFISFSENKNFFAISFDKPETKTDEHLIFVFDKKFQLIHELAIDSGEARDEKYNFVDMEVSDLDGTVYYLSKVTTKKNFFGIRKYEFEILKINQQSTQAFTFKKEGISYGSLRLRIDKLDNSLKAIGTYSEISDYYDKGIVMVSFDPINLEEYTTSLSPFSDDLIAQKYGNSKKKELRQYFIRDIVQKDNGDFIFISEELKVIDRSNEYGHVSSPFYFQFKDILVAEVSNEGAINWVKNINKHQEILNLAYLPMASFSGIVRNDEIYLFFNAKKILNKKNKPNVFFSSSVSPSRQYIVKLDNTGKMTYQEHTTDKPKMLYATGEAIFSSENNTTHLIITASSLNKRKFLKINLLESN
ncbi:hypothetical protein [Dokdonia sp.]|uniref:hypothetical protein n=1 Tax=Dokdonia sp. TaxID=2024995 RepID=UPI003267689B